MPNGIQGEPRATVQREDGAYADEADWPDVRLSGTPWVTLRMSVDDRTAANLTAVLVDRGPGGTARMVTRGWLDPQNREGDARSPAVEPGERYTMRWDLQPDPGTQLTLVPGAGSIRLPVAGGAGALR